MKIPQQVRAAVRVIEAAHKTGAPEPEAEMLTYLRWSQPEYFAWLNANRDPLWESSSTELKSEEDASDE